MTPKRKRDGEYSTNPHTVKANKRVDAMTEAEKEVHKAKDKVNKAINRALKALRNTTEWTSASGAARTLLEKNCRDGVHQKYRQSGTHPDQIAQNQGIIAKDIDADWMSDECNEEDIRQIEEQQIAQNLPEHVTRSYDLIKGTLDLHEKNAPIKVWESAVTRMMAGYYSQATNKDAFTSTIQEIIQSLKEVHIGQNYPEDLIYLQSDGNLKDQIRSLKSTGGEVFQHVVETNHLDDFQDYWKGALRTLYLKLWFIQYQPRRAVLYFTACQIFLQYYPDEAQWSYGDIDSNKDAEKNEILFRRIFQNLLNEARTMDYLGTNWEKIPEDDRTYVGVDREPYIVYIPNIWEILTLPEAIIWRELVRTKTWLPKKPRMTEKGKQRKKANQPKEIRKRDAELACYFFTRSIRFGGGKMIEDGSSPFFSRALFLGGRRKRVVPHLWRAKYSPRTQVRSVRNFGLLQMIEWEKYAAFMTKTPTILAPLPLPSIRNCMLGLTAAFVRKKLVQLIPRMSSYQGEDDDLRLDGERISLREDDGMPDSRLSCQVALKDFGVE